MSNQFYSVFSKAPSRRGSAIGQEDDKSNLKRSESRRDKDASQANITPQILLETEEPRERGIIRENSMNKKKKPPKDSLSRIASSIERQDSQSKKDKKASPKKFGQFDGGSRRGSLVPSVNQRKGSVFYVREIQKISDNQIINLNLIQDQMHAYRMLKFSADLLIKLRSPFDDLETLLVPVSSRTLPELIHDIFSITSNHQYYRQNEVLTWAKDDDFIDDILCAFAKQMVEFDSMSLLTKLLDSVSASTCWKIVHKAIFDIYALLPVENEKKLKAFLKETGSKILDHLLVVVGNWTWYLRQSHVDLCTQISDWFNTRSAQDWKESRIPVVYGAFTEGYDLTSLFGQIMHGTATLDLVTMNLLCTKIAVGLAKYPNQKELIHLDLFRHFVEFKAKIIVMAKLLQLCKLLEVEKERVFTAIESFNEKSTKANESNKNRKSFVSEKSCVFQKVIMAKTDLLNSLQDFKKITDCNSFSSAYTKVLDSQIAPCCSVFESELAAKISSKKKYDLPIITPKPIPDRRKMEAMVKKLSPKRDDDNDDFLMGGIAIQIDESPMDIPLISIIDEAPNGSKAVKVPDISSVKKQQSKKHLKTKPEDKDSEVDAVRAMPESVCTAHFTLSREDKDTIRALYGLSFDNVLFSDIKRILKVIGCSINAEDGIGLTVTHPRSKIPIFILAPFPDLHYKLYVLDQIKNALQDYLGIYYENFQYK